MSLLYEKFPFLKECKPLPVLDGRKKVIAEIAEALQIEPGAAARLIFFHVQRRRYSNACLTCDHVFDLHGNIVGDVAATQREQAAKALAPKERKVNGAPISPEVYARYKAIKNDVVKLLPTVLDRRFPVVLTDLVTQNLARAMRSKGMTGADVQAFLACWIRRKEYRFAKQPSQKQLDAMEIYPPYESPEQVPVELPKRPILRLNKREGAANL